MKRITRIGRDQTGHRQMQILRCACDEALHRHVLRQNAPFSGLTGVPCRHTPQTRFYRDGPVCGGRKPERAANIIPVGQRTNPRHHGRTSTAGGAAWRDVPAPRIMGAAMERVVGICAKGKLGRIGTANDDCARILQVLYHRRIIWRDQIL